MLFRSDDVGYVPRPDRRLTARRVYQGRITYNVIYTIGPNGFRLVPGSAPRPVDGCILLMGDSITFGQGVEDRETYASRLAELGERRWQVHNFGIPGWAPHQALAGLQSGRFQKAAGCTPTRVVFFFITDHYRRVAGYAPWEIHTPRYRVGADGRPVRAGNFDSDGPPALAPPDSGRSLLTANGWRRLVGLAPLPSPPQAGLMQALMLEIARTVKEIAPAARFDVVLWTEEDDVVLDALAAALTGAGVRLHPVERILPDYRKRWADYLLPDGDRHPTAATHARIAGYLAREIVRQ